MYTNGQPHWISQLELGNLTFWMEEFAAKYSEAQTWQEREYNHFCDFSFRLYSQYFCLTKARFQRHITHDWIICTIILHMLAWIAPFWQISEILETRIILCCFNSSSHNTCINMFVLCISGKFYVCYLHTRLHLSIARSHLLTY